MVDRDEDTGIMGGAAMRRSATWSRDVGHQAAYWPQKCIAEAINAGEGTSLLALDGQPMFSAARPVNPLEPTGAVYANLFTGVAAGAYPGALRIDETVTLEVAYANLAKLVRYIKSLKQPNGVDPLNVDALRLIVPPALMPRAVQLMSATIVNTTDGFAAIRKYLSFEEPIEARELGAAFGGSDVDFYVATSDIVENEDPALSPVVYVDREAFAMSFYGPESQHELQRKEELEWITKGRNGCAIGGRPYQLMKVKAT
jgi:hypothetical protein